MTIRERYLRFRVRRAGYALLCADERAAAAEQRLREAVTAYAEYKLPQGAKLKALWPSREDDYREVSLRG